MQAVAWRHLARGQSPRASVVCGALILAGTWIERSILEEALEWCIETWSNHPVAEVEVLEALQDLDAAGVLRTGIWDQLLPVASRPEATPILASWGSMMVRSPALEPTRYRSIVEHLPARWWSHLAPGILESELAFDLGRRWLELADVPWPALVLRPRGSEVTYPGGSGLHPGITTALRIRLDAFLPREAPPPCWTSEMRFLRSRKVECQRPGGHIRTLAGWRNPSIFGLHQHAGIARDQVRFERRFAVE